MLFSRYQLSVEYAAGGTVLEVACGSGQGLGHLRRHARFVVGADITEQLLVRARRHYGRAMPLAQLDAEALPFKPGTFDLVLLHEAIYYLPFAARFVEEAHRVLVPGGRLLITTINPDWEDFNPSPFSTSYLNARALRATLEERFREVHVFGGFPSVAVGPLASIVSILKRLAVRLRLMPRTMRGKRPLKRIFLGPLVEVPVEVMPDTGQMANLVPLTGSIPESNYKVIYAVGSK